MPLDNESRANAVDTGPIQGELDLDIPQAQNPFLKGFAVPLRNRRTGIDKGSLALVDMETGVVEDAAEIVRREVVDAEKFLKIFQAQMSVFFGLTAPSIKVLTAAFMEASRTPGMDYIHLSERIAAQHAEKSGQKLPRATYFRGRKGLIEAGIIAPSEETNRYWINPAIFFNGNRVRFVTELAKAPEIAEPGQGFPDDLDE